MKLCGRSLVVTGASQGLGTAIAEALVAEGASVALGARSLDKLEALKARLSPGLAAGQRITVARLDVSETADVDAFAAQTLADFPTLNGLINNAGVYGPMGAIEDVDWREWVDAITINLMGTVYPCRAFLPHFRARGYGKIINLSGGGATNPLPRVSAYAASKAAVVRFTETLAEEVRGTGIDVNAIAPGALATQMMDQLLAAGPEKVGAGFHARMSKIQQEGGTPLEKGASLCVYLASEQSDGVTAKLLSAVWDPWAQLQEHRADLESDIYTLRRIVPKDRGKDWGN